jgi:hypothetical protein
MTTGHKNKSKMQLTKIEAAIKDTKLRLENVKTEILLKSKERDVLQQQLDMLEVIELDPKNNYKK